eukprot:CAMPEP_0174305836 /NCGR_PEP_ID=MMETSP0810-20121108/64_1 /TAXON_ID=73025 ORGANISM="Eutreptiella gymnastica-like, Strain CCMP1594" /NCGR_SAMPLE_ID=MMETSP0810 /ASSEMBLY_ACC=CAM_ASM_000659 /LENGTH=122 /DNA_ID=CAMNT_0015412379 /DNA_START=648 /DNA_END=1016 /DNA_ORIENTATION=-
MEYRPEREPVDVHLHVIGLTLSDALHRPLYCGGLSSGDNTRQQVLVSPIKSSRTCCSLAFFRLSFAVFAQECNSTSSKRVVLGAGRNGDVNRASVNNNGGNPQQPLTTVGKPPTDCQLPLAE